MIMVNGDDKGNFLAEKNRSQYVFEGMREFSNLRKEIYLYVYGMIVVNITIIILRA